MTDYGTYGLFILDGIVLGLIAMFVLSRITRSLVSPYPRADMGRRLAAAGIDAAICLICYAILSLLGHLPASTLSPLYLLVRDGLMSGQSIGKAFVGLVVVRLEDGSPCTMWRSFQRNLVFAVPGFNIAALIFEAVTVRGDEQGMRIGDRLARTHVVEGKDAKDFVKSMQERIQKNLALLGEPEPLKRQRSGCR
ncbi:MAG: RDD family protein [Candidatus Latescibacteria bacterium]|jgi:uncharacterized RDD family membrane protein YckC|nr:RDD family protein [Candidatus Latescibacterota bacterium]